MPQAALRPLFEARCFSSSRCEPATGALRLLVTAPGVPMVPQLRPMVFQELYKKQFGVSVF
jgi:hypothetical protein